MGARGPAPKPTHLRTIEGNPSKRPLNGKEPKPEGPAVCPDWLPTYAKQIFHRVLSAMPEGLYTAADIETLTSYAYASHQARQAIEALEASPEQGGGAVLSDANGKKYRNPWQTVLGDANADIAKLGTSLGLTPAARARLSSPDSQKKGGKFKGLLGAQNAS